MVTMQGLAQYWKRFSPNREVPHQNWALRRSSQTNPFLGTHVLEREISG
jgi:hypothetical protein